MGAHAGTSVSTGICVAQLVWNWEPLQRCVGGDLSNQKAGIKPFAAAEVVARSLAAAQADAGDGGVLVQVSEGSRDPDRGKGLFTPLHDDFDYTAHWRGSWESLVDLGMQGSVQQSGVRYDSSTGNICCSQTGNTCLERFYLECGIQSDTQLLPDTILGGGAGALKSFNTSVFVTTCFPLCCGGSRADGHGRLFLAALPFTDAKDWWSDRPLRLGASAN